MQEAHADSASRVLIAVSQLKRVPMPGCAVAILNALETTSRLGPCTPAPLPGPGSAGATRFLMQTLRHRLGDGTHCGVTAPDPGKRAGSARRDPGGPGDGAAAQEDLVIGVVGTVGPQALHLETHL